MLLCSNVPKEDSLSGHEPSSDTTLHEDKHDVSQCSIRRDSLIAETEASNDTFLPTLFPFHLISGCSTAERNMCQYSRLITSQEVRMRIGLKGTLTWRCGLGCSVGAPTNPPTHAAVGRWTLGSAVIAPPRIRVVCRRRRDMQEQLPQRLMKPG